MRASPFRELPEGKGRPVKKERRYLTVCKQNTSDTDRTFFRFGPPTNPRASKYLNFMKLMADTGRALTYWDLHEICTGYYPSEVVRPVNRWGNEFINLEYNQSVKALCRYGYLRRLAYGRRGDPHKKGRPRALFTLTEKGRQSLERFEGAYSVSPYYRDTYDRVMAEKKVLYEGGEMPVLKRNVPPGDPVFNVQWIWHNKLKAESLGIKLRPWRV